MSMADRIADKIADIVNAHVPLTPLTNTEPYNPCNYSGSDTTYEYYYTGSKKGEMTRQIPAYKTARAIVTPGTTPILMPVVMNKEFPPMADGTKEGRRHHQGVSVAAIHQTIIATRPDKRNFYETLRATVKLDGGGAGADDASEILPAAPVDPHFDCDLDMIEFPDQSVHTARVLFQAYFGRWAAAHPEVGMDLDTIREVVLDATRPEKQSMHIVWKLPQHAKFQSNIAWGHVVVDVLVMCVEDLGLEGNPLFVRKTRGTRNGALEPYYVSIVDTSIYTPHRAFRFEGCVKAKFDAKRLLYPLIQKDGKSIEERTLTDFAATMVTYLPRDSMTGAPLPFSVISYQSSLIEPGEGINKFLNLFYNGERAGFTTNLSASAPAEGRVGDGSVPITGNKRTRPDEVEEEEGDDDHGVTITQLARVICSILNHHHPEFNATKKMAWSNGMIQLDSTCRRCVYARREHKHNTIFFMAFLNYPKPHVYYYCRDAVDCQHLYVGIPKARIMVELPDDAWEQYTNLMHKYMLSQTVTAAPLAKLFEITE
jgi:hypothetical protein